MLSFDECSPSKCLLRKKTERFFHKSNRMSRVMAHQALPSSPFPPLRCRPGLLTSGAPLTCSIVRFLTRPLLLLVSFASLYRFGPNLKYRRWQAGVNAAAEIHALQPGEDEQGSFNPTQLAQGDCEPFWRG
jgi:hypothetical protein